MPLSPEELRELEELELQELEEQEAAETDMAQAQPQQAEPSMMDSLQAGLEGFGQTATMGYLPEMQAGVGKMLGLGDYEQLKQENYARQAQQAEQSPTATTLGKVAGIAGSIAAPAGAARLVGRVAPSAGAALSGMGTSKSLLGAAGRGAAMGAAYNPGQSEVDPNAGGIEQLLQRAQLGERAKGGAIGGAAGGALQGIGSLLRKGGDVGMQVATGQRRYTPGAGEVLAEQGIMGTKSAMRRQVGQRMGETGERMQQLARGSDAMIDSPGIASEVVQSASRGIAPKNMAPLGLPGPGVQPSARDLPQLQKIQELGTDIASRGKEPASVALQRRMAAGASGYSPKTQDPLTSFIGKLSKAEQKAYSTALKEAVPGLAKEDVVYSALSKASKGLESKTKMPDSLLGLISAAKPSNIPGGALATSVLSRGAIGAGKGAQASQEPTLKALLEALREKGE